MDRWKTYHIPCSGGMVLNLPQVVQAKQAPGSLTSGVNFETGRKGGYRRVSGYSKFDDSALPGTGDPQTVLVQDNKVIGVRDGIIHESAGAGWTALNSGDLMDTSARVQGAKYNWTEDVIVLVDGATQAFKWTSSTLTRITAGPTAPIAATEFKRHLFLAEDSVVTFSAPNNDTDFAAANGAGEFNVGFTVKALAKWRDQLYIFGRNQISKLTGDNASNFVLNPVSSRLGIVDRDTIQEISGDLVYLADDGVRTIAGTERISDVELGSISNQIYPLINDLGSRPAVTFSSTIISKKGQYRLFVYDPAFTKQQSEGFVGCLNVRGGQTVYEWFELRGFQAACADSGYNGDLERVVHADGSGFVYTQESANDFDGDEIIAYFETPYITYDDEEVRKTIYKVKVYLEAEGTIDAKLSLKFNNGSSDTIQPSDLTLEGVDSGAVFGTAVFGTATFVELSGSLQDKMTVGSGINNSFLITSQNNFASFTIKELVVEYGVHGRR